MHLSKGCKILALALIVGATAVAARADETTYNVAVLPSWKNWFHVHDFDWVFKSLGYKWTNCVETAEQIDWLDKNLEKYDLLIAPPLFHYEKGKEKDPEYTRPYNMDKLGPHIAKWIQDGGCFIGVDMNYPQGMDWYAKMDPLMEISSCVDPADMKTEKKCNGFGPPVVENNDSMLYFPRSVEPGFCWGHMVIPPALVDKSAWKVISTCGHGKGFPTLVVRRWGKGIIVLSSTRAYVSELIQNIRVNQKFAQLGVLVTDSTMPDPLPGKNSFAFSCNNSSDRPFEGELVLTIYPRIANPDKDPNNSADKKKPDFIDDPDQSHWFVANASDIAPAKSDHAFKLDCFIPTRGSVHAVMKFRSGDTDAVVFDRYLTLPELFVVSGPPYRSIVSVARRFKDITFTTHIYPFKENLDELTINLDVKSPSSNVVAKASFPAEYGKTFHKVNVPLNLPAGKYTIVSTLVKTEGGDVVDTSETVLDIMDNGPGFAAFDEDNTLIVEGEPFMPLGIYHPRDKKWTKEGFKDVADVGFNVVDIFGWMGVGSVDILRPVDVSCLWEQLPHRSPVMCMEHAWTLAYHPSALINYTIDEPAESQFAFVKQLDEAWRKYDPYHPTFLASYQPHHFERNARISDILAPDPYPYSQEKGDDSDIALVARRVELARAASDGVNPVFCVPQSFGSEPPYIWRNMGLQAIVHGAKGLIWYAWNEGHDGPWGGLVWHDELIAEAEVFLAQLKLLAPAYLGNAENQPKMFTLVPGKEPVWTTILGSKNVKNKHPYDNDTVLHGMVCRDPKKGTRYLILVNTSKEPFACDLKVDEVGQLTQLEGAFGETALKVENGVVKVDLGKFGSGIWYWDGPKPVMPRPMSDFAVRELPARASGKTLTVAADGQYTSLQAAIDAASDGDVIKVAEGKWGSIVCDNKLIDIVATGSRAKTIINGNGGRAATLTQRHQGRMNFETNTLIRGFVIEGGNSKADIFRPKYGGGVIGGTLVDCVIQNNKAKYGGGAAFANVFNCVFKNNSASLNGGAMSICNVRDSYFEENSASFDGGAAEFCDVDRCVFRKNKAGRRGGAATSGSIKNSKFFENSAEVGGGVCRGSTSYSLFVRNKAKKDGGAIASTDPSFCTVAYNTVDSASGKASGVSGRANFCLLVNNTCKANRMMYQALGYRNNPGEGSWYVSSTNNYPAKAQTFTLAAFVNAEKDNFRLTSRAPFIDAVGNKFIAKDVKDIYGERRLSGGGMEPGAAEFQSASQVIYDIDAAKASPLASTAVAGAELVPVNVALKLPTIDDGCLSFVGTNAARTVRAMATRWPKFRIESEFRASAAGPVFSFANRLSATVLDDGTLRLSSIQGNNASSNICVSAKSVLGKTFNKLVVEIDRFGGANGAIKAELNGADFPATIPFSWKDPAVFNFDKDQIVTFGFGANQFFTGDIKTFKVTGYAD